MNDTPCTLCNHYRRETVLARVRGEKERLHWLIGEQEKHLAECQIKTDGWYLGLWESARVGVDVIEVTK